ncbi:MAG TPA: hypothetical protein VHP12_00680 [Chitinophagaceae bacterium]|nr:hypothetical protein [Chitinophagaceae bacterium]
MMNTRASIDRSIFYSLNDKDLLRNIFPEDFLNTIRGKHYSFKQKALEKLSKGQYSVFMFMVIIFHNAFGWEFFLSQYEHEVNNGAFEEYKSGVTHLGDGKLLENITRCEVNYFSMANLQKKQMIYKVLDSEFTDLKKESLKNTANYIRNHPEEFVDFR